MGDPISVAPTIYLAHDRIADWPSEYELALKWRARRFDSATGRHGTASAIVSREQLP